MKNSLVNLAKGRTTTPTVKKPVVKATKVIEKPKSKEEERDEKAKETVEKLLKDVELSPKKEIVEEIEAVTVNVSEGAVWLEEQVALLTEENDKLKSELIIAKEDYSKLFQKLQGGNTTDLEGETLRQNILFFFTEMQNAYLGNNPQGQRYVYAYPERLLPKLVQLFPFLQNYQKF